MRRNRSETELIAAVLSCCEEPHRISAVIRDANIPHSMLYPMMEHLVKQGLLLKEEHSDATYATTPEGGKFLSEYRRFQNICDAYAIRA